MQSPDPVSLGIAWDRLISIADEMMMALIRTAFSTVVRESYDLSCILFDAKGRSIAQGSYSVPSFIGTAPLTLGHMLAKYPPDSLRPGDVLATNDPWWGTGHVYDICVARPVFRGDRLVGYTMSVTHLPDIGGMGLSATAKDVHEEGLRLPVSKLLIGGERNAELFELLRMNVRAVDQVIGDIDANISCNGLGGRLLLEFLEEFGVDDLTPLADAILDSSERAMREKIAAIPDGRYRSEIRSEAWQPPLRLACQVTVAGEEIGIDFQGTDGWVPAGVNVPLCYTRALSLYAVKCLTVPKIPNNEGATRPVRVAAPEGSILNALPPAPTGGRHVHGHLVPGLVFHALAQALPDLVPADPGMFDVVNFQGRHADGSDLSTVYFASGGNGATDGKDGDAATPAPSNMAGVPIEVWEANTSVSVRRKTLLADSGGAGRWRGGLGQDVTMRNDTGHPLTVSCFALRTQFPPAGVQGGGPGARRQTLVNGQEVPPRARIVLAPGDHVSFLQAGGGGYGPPEQRDPVAERRDRDAGFVGVAEAAGGR